MPGLQRRSSAKGSGLQRRILLLFADCLEPPVEKLADCLVNNGRPQPPREFLLQIPCRCSKRDWGARLQVVARSGVSDAYCRAAENRGKRGRGVRPGDRAILGAIT